MSNPAILFVDDDADIQKTAELLLRKEGYVFRSARSPAEAYSILSSEPIDVVLLDLNFSRAQVSGEEGLTCLREIRRHNRDAVVVVVTGHSGLTVAIQALRLGAANFIMKPWNDERLLEAVREGIDQRRHNALGTSTTYDGLDDSLMVGECEAILRIKGLVDRYAVLTASILIQGETGTGKTLLAKSLHSQSGRAVLKILEAADLSMDELSDLADCTLVLLHIDQLAPSLAMPLSAWLQTAGRANNRVVATTSKASELRDLQRGLMYALSTLEINLPPLRSRNGDPERLAEHFVRIFASQHRGKTMKLAPDAINEVRAAFWKDNVHALRRAVERAVLTTNGDVIGAADLNLSDDERHDLGEGALSLESTEKHLITEALKRNAFNVSKAATDLGLTRQTLYRRMARHGL